MPMKKKKQKFEFTVYKSTLSKSTVSKSSAGVDTAAGLRTTNLVKCAVVDGKDQALFCEGSCKGWFHR